MPSAGNYNNEIEKYIIKSTLQVYGGDDFSDES